MNHQSNCNCAICNGLDYESWKNKCMAETGWYAHYVPENNVVNAHTHGLIDSQNHLDFQILFPIEQKTAHSIFTTLCDRVKNGERFHNNDVLENVIGNGYKIKLFLTNEGNRPVLRIIFPNVDGNLELIDFEKDSIYESQYSKN